MGDLTETSQENHGRPLWQIVISSNKTSTKRTSDLGRTFHLSSTHISELLVGDGNSSGMKPEELNVCESMFRPSEPEERHAGENPEDSDGTGSFLRDVECSHCQQKSQTLQQPFECNRQGKGFRKEAVLLTHRRAPVEVTAYKHSECWGARDGSALIAQGRTHMGRTFCQKETPLNLHRADFQEQQNPCNQSGKNFSKKSHLIQLQRIRLGEKTFACKICGKTFYKRANLTRHQKIHTGEKLYKCSECERTFIISKTVLREHQRTPTGEKHYACDECEKPFCRKSDLTVHWRIHTGEDPFECSKCGKSFCQKSALTAHQRIHNRYTPHECNDCDKTSVRSQYSLHIRELTQERDLMHVKNVRIPFAISQPLLYIRELTQETNLTDIMNVGNPSV
nr:zinc finger protein 717-like [Vicugna pacos]XP_031529834.1 zinc finger protein 717-like [Vicugna pacos]XP_031529835.1 zinc finger protein 717-like [Vicugna pacos]XP_031529836.1 zinc finger protein 717-like [Vicugna pacos]XP_031529837.1 zinc finger protein 717-like [Vicugna pacos]XP_031529838.1 zinc finger protein 717-like [Vicugna pacos]XP_031529839.1 zinc finger protein 717-like [Vicugna pacos]XP_031529840.1 zinc finger protein 717-like [Vicugna pacos]